MKLVSMHTYKSITEPISIDLPDLTIITGVNGVGKTHLLMGISIGIIKLYVDNILSNDLSDLKCKYIPWQNLNPKDSSVIQYEEVNRTGMNLWNNVSSFQQILKLNSAITIEHMTTVDTTSRNIIKYIMKRSGKNLGELKEIDFIENFPLDNLLENQDVFGHNLGIVFKRYYSLWDSNTYNRYLHNHGNNKYSFKTDEEFNEYYGEPPWDLLNKIVDEAKLDFEFTSPVGLHRDAPFEVKLIDKNSRAAIKISELSSGEKVLMSLALAVYNSTAVSSTVEFPKVLLLDEPDASLHPRMAQQFLHVIERVFVKDKGMKVIMTTHSPSTVALAKEECLFVMNKTNPRLVKTTKDKALKALTSGVPSFSVNYENRRQVFVESQYDVAFYEKINDKLETYLDSEISLSFIPSGSGGDGGCEQVKNVVSTLNSFGNKFIFGIVDWDQKNISKGPIKVLGEGKRYSLENYIYDPLLLAAFLLREKFIKNDKLKFQKNETYLDFKNLNPQRLATAVKFVTDKVSSHIGATETEMVRTKYLQGFEAEIPKWYLICNGHRLEEALKESFPQLKRYKNELKREILEKVIDDVPELIPYDLLDLLRSIQRH